MCQATWPERWASGLIRGGVKYPLLLRCPQDWLAAAGCSGSHLATAALRQLRIGLLITTIKTWKGHSG